MAQAHFVTNPVLITRIPELKHREARQMAEVELGKFLELLESLESTEWENPTCCDLWNIRQIVAHVLGTFESYTSFKEFWRQTRSKNLKPYFVRGMSFLDAMNQLQVDDRETLTPTQLKSRLALEGRKAIKIRSNIPVPVRVIRVPLAPLGGWVPIGYLTDLIYTRDIWIHRIDIGRASGRDRVMSKTHDGRMVELMFRDLRKQKFEEPVQYLLEGIAGGQYQVGNGQPVATLSMDTRTFILLASGRLKAGEALEKGLAQVSGNLEAARKALFLTQVPV